jgi:phenylalanyl-tRNA synthetase beta chain
MLVPYSWLRDFAPLDGGPDALVPVLNGLGMVVEAVTRVGEGLGGVTVARVVRRRPHPGADRVQLVDVDAGDGEIQVVCGAFNFEAGDLVPLAPVGTILPGNFEIGRRKVMGEWSEGMLCSATELGLGADADGIMVVGVQAAPGTPLTEALGLQPDVVFDLDITANRPDAMSIAGVARDVAAKLRVPFHLPASEVGTGKGTVEDLASLIVEAPDLSPRFTVRVIEGVEIGTSPDWVRRRLTLAGMRPINSAVDASNYVMLELGQPTHPYDLDKLPGAGLLVRRGRPGETLTTLDGVERHVGHGDDCLICDGEGTPVGIGGIMGGASSEIDEGTTRVLLEAAYFTPMAIARTAKRLKLRTEASARFERGTDPEIIDLATDRLISLIGAAPAAGTLDVRSLPKERPVVRTRVERVGGLLGRPFTAKEITGYIEPIGFATREVEPGVLDVTVPSWRPDVGIEVDIIEEVARHHGYENLPRTVPRPTKAGGLTTFQLARRRLRDILNGLGISEASSPPLLGPGDHERAGLSSDVIVASDPMIREESVLRTSLLPHLLRGLAFNASHRNPDARLFEIGHVFLPTDRSSELPDERERLAVALAGSGAPEAVRVWRTIVEVLRLEDLQLVADAAPGLHPGRTARIERASGVLGYVGEADPAVVEAHGLEGRVAWLEVDLEPLLNGPTRPEEMRPVSRYPSSDIDLAFTVPETVAAGAVEATLRESVEELLEWVRLFDVYRGEAVPGDTRSLAFRLRFQAQDRTLTDEEIAGLRQQAIDAVESTHGAQLRG